MPYLAIAVLGAVLLVVFWIVAGPKAPESQFRVREADRLRDRKLSGRGDDLAQAKLRPKAGPILLEGIRLDARPHEILGVSPQATADEIQRAYREKMKRYHPDKIGRQGSREWQDAQKIAEALNRARDELIRKRSGSGT